MADVTLSDIEAAARRLRGSIRETPTTLSHSLSTKFGRTIFLKREFLQRTGSFKLRGAFNLLATLPAGAKVVAASAGNHAQGVALAARSLEQYATIFMPVGASLPKVAATQSYGATVIQVGATTDEAIVAACEFAESTGATFVSPFDHPAVIAGQGTIGLEILEQCPEVSTVVVAIGGGGLCGGIAAAIKSVRPEVTVVGVNAEGANSMEESLLAGHLTSVHPHTIADGIAIGSPSELTLRTVRRYVDHVVTVSDDDIAQAVLLLVERAKAVVEPAGAAPLAALAAGKVRGSGPVVAVLGGGNIDPMLLANMMRHGLTVANRYFVLNVTMPDTPGSLARLAVSLADLSANVTEVVHQRAGRQIRVGEVSIEVTMETRDRAHQELICDTLTADGFGVSTVVQSIT